MTCSRTAAATPARFEDYPATVEIIKQPVPVRILDAQSRRYRTELRETSRRAPNFAGHFILATWGCGASCIMSPAIDAKTGSVTRLPFTVSNWPLDVTEPLVFKPDSRLLVIHGSRNESATGIYDYELVDHGFRLLSETSIKPCNQPRPFHRSPNIKIFFLSHSKRLIPFFL